MKGINKKGIRVINNILKGSDNNAASKCDSFHEKHFIRCLIGQTTTTCLAISVVVVVVVKGFLAVAIKQIESSSSVGRSDGDGWGNPENAISSRRSPENNVPEMFRATPKRKTKSQTPMMIIMKRDQPPHQRRKMGFKKKIYLNGKHV